MDDFAVDVYLREVGTQCRFALNAAKALDNVLPRMSVAAHEGDRSKSKTLHEEVFRTIHSLLTHSSNVSRLLWPAPPRRGKKEADAAFQTRCSRVPRVERAARLRTVLSLPDDAHVLTSRQLRDHLEHFDERLDDWRATSQRRNIVHDMIGPRGMIVGIDETDTMRWFDPTEYVFRFRGDEFDLGALIKALGTLIADVDHVVEQRERDRYQCGAVRPA
jgi:hypothetical protein